MASTDSTGNICEHRLEDQLKILHEKGYLYVRDKTIGEELTTEAMRRGATDTAEFLAFVVKKTIGDKVDCRCFSRWLRLTFILACSLSY